MKRKGFKLVSDWREILECARLRRGSGHGGSPAQVCVMQAIELITNPSMTRQELNAYKAESCVSRVLRNALVSLNDSVDVRDRHLLRRLIPSFLGTRDIPDAILHKAITACHHPRRSCRTTEANTSPRLAMRRLATVARALARRYPIPVNVLDRPSAHVAKYWRSA